MTQETETVATTVPLSESPIVDAIVTTPLVTPAVEIPASTEPAIAEPEQPAPEGPHSHTETPTLMESFVPDEQAEPLPEAVEPPPPEPLVYEFTLPEGVVGDGDQIDSYKEVLGKHAVAPEVGQELIDMHAQAMSRYADQMLEQQHRVFADTRANWRNEVMSDEEIGGSGHQTAMNSIFRMRDLFVPERDRTAFNDFLRVTGAGDHPAFLRLLHRVGKLFDEGQPAPAPAGPAPQPNQRRMGTIYDHPTSRRGR